MSGRQTPPVPMKPAQDELSLGFLAISLRSRVTARVAGPAFNMVKDFSQKTTGWFSFSDFMPPFIAGAAQAVKGALETRIKKEPHRP